MTNIVGKVGRTIGLTLLTVPLGTLLMPQGALNAAPKTWVKVATSSQTKIDYYIDRATLKKQPGFSYFWVYFNSSVGQALGTEKRTPVYGVAMYLSADCRKANLRVRTVELLNQQGQRIDQENRGDFGPLAQFNQQNPVGRSVLKYVCNR